MAYKEIEDIEVGNIQVVDREGARYKLQCLKTDIANLPTNGIANGSTVLILDATGVESKVYVFHKAKNIKQGIWYSLDSEVTEQIIAGKIVYDSTNRSVE